MTPTSSDQNIQSVMALVGRIIFSAVFIFGGISKVINFSPMAAEIAQQTMIANASLLLVLAIIFQLGGGLLVLFGLYTRVGALMLFMFIIPETFFYHSFWIFDSTAHSAHEFQQFMKNFAMCGATLYMMAYGGGKYAFDRLLHRD